MSFLPEELKVETALKRMEFWATLQQDEQAMEYLHRKGYVLYYKAMCCTDSLLPELKLLADDEFQR